ncbi:hypothetical protein GCM10028807_50420 [Spirosoma daeguense]
MMFTRYLLCCLIGIQTSYGQSETELRRLIETTKAEPVSIRRDSLLHRAYIALAERYNWGSNDAPANYDSAVYFATQAIQISPNLRLKADALRMRGTLHHSTELGFTSAWMGLDDLNQAANLYISLHDRKGLQETYAALATLYLIRYNPDDVIWGNSLKYATLAMRMQSDSTFRIPEHVAAPATDSPATLAQIQEAIQVFKQNLAYWRQKESKPHQMWRLERLGQLYHKSGLDVANGKKYMQQALQLALTLPDMPIAFACLTNLAQWELDDRNYAASLRYARQGLQLSQQQNAISRQAGFHDRLYHTFRAMGQMDSAYAHKDDNIAINDSLARVGDQRQILHLKEKVEAQKRQRELEQKLQKQANVLYLLMGVGLLLASIVALFVWRNKLLYRKNIDLRKALLEGQTIERQRVAADLHDNLGTTLSALRWNLESIDKTQLNTVEQSIYDNISQQVGQAYNDVRLLSHNLLPGELAKQGLAVALQNLVEKLTFNTSVRFSIRGIDALPRLDQQTEFELYSICLELLNNTLKHAQASESEISISQTNATLHLTVSDNGIGLSPQRQNGRGLQNVAARIDTLGGTWTVTAGKEGGVYHQITVPIRKPARVSSQT